MSSLISNSYMLLAIEQAKLALLCDEVPVGAVIIDSITNNIIAKTHNLCEHLKNPTAHAEMLAIEQACSFLGTTRLINCDLYVTLEPCPMCASAISMARIRRLYFGSYDAKTGGVEHGPRIFTSPSTHHIPEIYGGIRESESAKILRDFFKKKR